MLPKLTEQFHTHYLTWSSQHSCEERGAAITNLVLQRRKLTWRIQWHVHVKSWKSSVAEWGMCSSLTVHSYLMLHDSEELRMCRLRYTSLEVESFPCGFHVNLQGSRNALLLSSCVCSSHSRMISFKCNLILSYSCLSLAWHGILLTMACKTRHDLALPGLQPHLCYSL